MTILRNEKGFIKLAFYTALLAFIIYTGIQFGMPYYRHSAFKSDVKEIARISLGDAERTKVQVMDSAEGYGIPLDENNVKVVKKEKTTQVKASWSENVDILGVYQKMLNFEIDIEE